MDLKPVYARIVVKRKETVEKIGSIIIPDAAKASFELSEGTVMAVGPNADEVEKGDEVLFGKYAGGTIERAGEEYLIMNDEDVLAVIDKGVA